MKKIKVLENKGREAVRLLRKSKLSQGVPFMINTEKLPAGQCYYEYPNGIVRIIAIDKKHNDFKIIKTLSIKESSKITKQFY